MSSLNRTVFNDEQPLYNAIGHNKNVFVFRFGHHQPSRSHFPKTGLDLGLTKECLLTCNMRWAFYLIFDNTLKMGSL